MVGTAKDKPHAEQVFMELLAAWETARESLDEEFSGDFDASDRRRAEAKAEWLRKWEGARRDG